AAISRSDHPYWSRYHAVRSLIGILDVLGNRQLRPAIISAILKFSEPSLLDVLGFFIDLLVRYQIVGRRRTGALEIGAARIAKKIYSGEINSRINCEEELSSLWISDEEFLADFSRFRDAKGQRVLYLALALHAQSRTTPLELLSVPVRTVSSAEPTLGFD